MSGTNVRLEMTGVDAMNELAQQARYYYDISPLAKIELLKFEENAVYLVGDTKNGVSTLLHIRNPRCSKELILSELLWMQEILKSSLVIVPEPVPGLDGGLVQALHPPYSEIDYHCVMLKFFSGTSAGGEMSDPAAHSKRLGRVAALLHQSGISLNNPLLLSRPAREYDLFSDTEHEENAFSGRMSVENERLLLRTIRQIRRRLETYGRSGKRYGLIHGGLGFDNLHFFNNRITVLNFESCGSGWFLSDCGALLSPTMQLPLIPGDALSLWLDGYREIRNLTSEDLAEAPTFLMLHRLNMLWRMLKFPTDPAQSAGISGFIGSTAALCETYLS